MHWQINKRSFISKNRVRLNTAEIRDYSLPGRESKLSVEKGLADAKWYTTYVPRESMKGLLVRKNSPAIKDTLLWFTLIFGSGYLVYLSWGHWWFVFPYLVYSVLYASTSDSRWHESSHGTAFKIPWMNNALYDIASFMVFRQSVPWRWSHFRHHSDTIIRGRDHEIAVPRPVNLISAVLKSVQLMRRIMASAGISFTCTGSSAIEMLLLLSKNWSFSQSERKQLYTAPVIMFKSKYLLMNLI